jgi:cell division protein FtsZ
VHEAISLVQDRAHPDANVIFRVVIDESQEEEIRITVIATGIGRSEEGIEAHVQPPDLKPVSVEQREGRNASGSANTEGGYHGSQVIDLDKPAFLRQAASMDA